jgi:uncharacterized protein YlxW (UPF0749 family)
MASISPHVRGKSWLFQITALCIVLGMLLALSLKTQRQVATEGNPLHLLDVRAALRITRESNLKLQKDLAAIKADNEKLARQQAAGLTSASSLEHSLNEAKMLAGAVGVRGPGVMVTLHDSPKISPTASTNDMQNYIVHDYDLRSTVNELFSSGAEAVSINGQRLIASSSIRCVGAVILVNSVQAAPPYVIKAVGKPDVLEKSLTLPGGAADGLFLLDMIEVKRMPDLFVPAFKGSTKFIYGRPVDQP